MLPYKYNSHDFHDTEMLARNKYTSTNILLFFCKVHKMDHCIQDQILLSSLPKPVVIIFFSSERNCQILLHRLKITLKQFLGVYLNYMNMLGVSSLISGKKHISFNRSFGK